MDASLFISDALHEREIETADGGKHLVRLREIPAAKFRAFQEAERSKDEAVRETSMARLIAASLCDPDGKQSLTVEEAARLKPAVSGAIVQHILDVNGFGPEKKASPSETASGSGTS